MKSLRIENKKQPRIGDVLLIQETYQEIRTKIWDLGESSRNANTAKVIVPSKHLPQRLLNLLYPLECGDETSSIVHETIKEQRISEFDRRNSN